MYASACNSMQNAKFIISAYMYNVLLLLLLLLQAYMYILR